jgi:hypothetical protein
VIGDHAFRQGDHIRLDAHGKLALLPPAHPR